MTITKPISYNRWRDFKINPPLTFENIVFPRIQRVFARLLALDLVQVRPMNHPIGNLDFLDQIIMKKNHIPRKPISFGDWRRLKKHGLIFSPYLPMVFNQD